MFYFGLLKSIQENSRWGLALMLLILSACATNPKVAEYPTREIDRPYTLPKGIANWQTFAGVVHHNSSSLGTRSNTASDQHFIIYPLVWTQSLSDHLQLTWLPFPLILNYQIEKNENGYWGTGMSMGVQYNSYDGFSLLPSINLKNRRILSSIFALDTNLFSSFRLDIDPQENQNAFQGAGLQVQPIFQISNELSAGPTADIILDNSGTNHYFRFPLGAQVQYSLSHQWQFSVMYQNNEITTDPIKKVNVGILTSTYFW